MARTTRRKPYRFYSHENHVARVLTRRRFRAKVKQAIRKDVEALPLKRGTEGWITW